MRINVAFAIESKYVRYLYVALRSILINKDEDDELYFYVLNSDLEDNGKAILSKLAEGNGATIKYTYVDENLFPPSLPVVPGWPHVIYYRLLLAELLGDDVDRIIYIDADIVVNSSLKELYTESFENKLICGCRNFGEVEEGKYRNKKLYESLRTGKYVNSGLLLLNLKDLKNQKYDLNRYLDAARELNYELVFPDMDLINYVHKDHFRFLDEYKYNLFASEAYSEGIKKDRAKDSVIIHYAGYKPWDGGHIHYDTEMLWWEYAKETPFYEEFASEYIQESINDPFVYDTLSKYIATVNELNRSLENAKEELELRKQLNDKLLAIVEGQDNI